MTAPNLSSFFPLHFDGHGLNALDGARILNFSRHPQRDGGDYILTFEQREAIAKSVSAHTAILTALEFAYKIADAWCYDTNPHGDLVRGDSMEHDAALTHRETMRTALELAGYSFND